MVIKTMQTYNGELLKRLLFLSVQFWSVSTRIPTSFTKNPAVRGRIPQYGTKLIIQNLFECYGQIRTQKLSNYGHSGVSIFFKNPFIFTLFQFSRLE